jgi:hypothetical protein
MYAIGKWLFPLATGLESGENGVIWQVQIVVMGKYPEVTAKM